MISFFIARPPLKQFLSDLSQSAPPPSPHRGLKNPFLWTFLTNAPPAPPPRSGVSSGPNESHYRCDRVVVVVECGGRAKHANDLRWLRWWWCWCRSGGGGDFDKYAQDGLMFTPCAPQTARFSMEGGLKVILARVGKRDLF